MKLSCPSSVFATILMLSKSDVVRRVHGHASITSPASRQWYAHTFGQAQWEVEEGEDIYPKPEYNVYGFQAGGYEYGACGMLRADRPDKDYTNNYVTTYGNPVPWFSQATYDQGSLIEIEVVTTANHQGHFEFGLCPNWENPTQECFDANLLMFVEDVYYGAPVDPSHPHRGYMAPGGVPNKVENEKGNQIIRHIYKLPDNIYGDKILMQWHWVSQLGCKSEGYADYDWPESWGIGTWFNPVCEVDENGRLPSAGNSPQQYWHCSEISIRASEGTSPTTPSPVNPTPPTPMPQEQPVPTTPSPVDPPTPMPQEQPVQTTPSPVNPTPLPSPMPTNEPTTASPVSSVEDGPNACCSQKFDSCVAWCGTTREECLACPEHSRVFWLPNGPPPSGSCTARWHSCTNNVDSCCDGLVCVGNQYHAQCEHPSDLSA